MHEQVQAEKEAAVRGREEAVRAREEAVAELAAVRAELEEALATSEVVAADCGAGGQEAAEEDRRPEGADRPGAQVAHVGARAGGRG